MELDIVLLFRAIWILCILPFLIASLPSSKLKSIREHVLGVAGRGKILHSSTSQKLTVPQKFYTHFYVTGVVWTALLLATIWIYACKTAPLTYEHRLKVWRAVFLLVLMEMHVLRRLIESIYVFKYSPSARMHTFGYLIGIFCYVAIPLSLCSNIASEVARFARNQAAEFIAKEGKSHTSSSPEFDLLLLMSPLMKLGSIQLIGAAVFLLGWIHQRRCHAILGSLRESPRQSSEYIIPHGDWFGMVSCPHYLAEIVLYAGLLIASGGTDINMWLLFGFVVANLTFAAGETHRWYLKKFENYPANRSAIFPYVY